MQTDSGNFFATKLAGVRAAFCAAAALVALIGCATREAQDLAIELQETSSNVKGETAKFKDRDAAIVKYANSVGEVAGGALKTQLAGGQKTACRAAYDRSKADVYRQKAELLKQLQAAAAAEGETMFDTAYAVTENIRVDIQQLENQLEALEGQTGAEAVDERTRLLLRRQQMVSLVRRIAVESYHAGINALNDETTAITAIIDQKSGQYVSTLDASLTNCKSGAHSLDADVDDLFPTDLKADTDAYDGLIAYITSVHTTGVQLERYFTFNSLKPGGGPSNAIRTAIRSLINGDDKASGKVDEVDEVDKVGLKDKLKDLMDIASGTADQFFSGVDLRSFTGFDSLLAELKSKAKAKLDEATDRIKSDIGLSDAQ